MLCVVCRINELTGKQEKYCSKSCERKSWRDNNRQKLLESKRRYRDENKNKIRSYNIAYKKRVKKMNDRLAVRLKQKHNCLRCESNENLEVHHIKHQDIGGGQNDQNNLVVLCKRCHALWHKMFPKSYWEFGIDKLNGVNTNGN